MRDGLKIENPATPTESPVTVGTTAGGGLVLPPGVGRRPIQDLLRCTEPELNPGESAGKVSPGNTIPHVGQTPTSTGSAKAGAPDNRIAGIAPTDW